MSSFPSSVSPENTSAMPALIASRYRPLRELGRGGMGVVYLAEHVNTNERFALKVLLGDLGSNPQAIERFKMEARASARIGSENVVRMIDADQAPELGGALFLAMELLDGMDLDKRVSTVGPMTPAQVGAVMLQVARALDKAHAAGVIHRDLKPENLFLHRREDGSFLVKILDFGISKFLDPGSPEGGVLGLTKTGLVMGTPLYMATEQIRGGKVSPRTDVWALGLIAFYLLTGTSYWRSASNPDAAVMTLVAEISVDPLEPPSRRAASLGAPVSWPWAFDGWFLRCVCREPEGRFESAGDAVQALLLALEVDGEREALGGADRLSAPATSARERLPSPRTAQPAGVSTGMAMTQSSMGQRSSVVPVAGHRPLLAALGVGALVLLALGGWWSKREAPVAAHGAAASAPLLPARPTPTPPVSADLPVVSLVSPSSASASPAPPPSPSNTPPPPPAPRGKMPANTPKTSPENTPAKPPPPAPPVGVDAYGGR
jgi:serine/threonine protein kinase